MPGLESVAYGTACIAFGVLCALFYVLWQANLRGAKECEEAAKFLDEIDDLENPVEEAARFLRMDQKDVALELTKGRLHKLVGERVASTAAILQLPFSFRWM